MWQGIDGHDEVVEQFRRTMVGGRLASTFLFVGPAGVGKRAFALKFAQALLCREVAEAELAPCGACGACAQVLALTHPDLIMISKPADKNKVLIEQMIGRPERRMREGLCHDIGLKPFAGGRKIAVIDDADVISLEAANSLLKTLEEPPAGAVIILIGTSASQQLPTIRSRSQIVRFAPLDAKVVARLLVEQQVVDDRQEAARLAELAGGSLTRAIELADPDLQVFRQQFVASLSAPVLDSVRTAQMVGDFVDAAGREAIDRRRRLRQVIGLAAEHFRQVMRTSVDAAHDAAMHHTGVEQSVARVERCLDALEHVDRYVNQATLIGSWIDDLAA